MKPMRDADGCQRQGSRVMRAPARQYKVHAGAPPIVKPDARATARRLYRI